MGNKFQSALDKSEEIYLKCEKSTESIDDRRLTTNIIEGMMDNINKFNQNAVAKRDAYKQGGMAALGAHTTNPYKQQWNQMSPELRAPYDDDYQKFETYQKQQASQQGMQTKEDVKYMAAWQAVPTQDKVQYFDNNLQTYARAATAFHQYLNTEVPQGEQALDWNTWTANNWMQIKNATKSTNPGAPYKQQKWAELSPQQQQSLTNAGHTQQSWDVIVASLTPGS